MATGRLRRAPQPLSFDINRALSHEFRASVDVGPRHQSKRDHQGNGHGRSQLPCLKTSRTPTVPIVSHYSLLHAANQAKMDGQVNRAVRPTKDDELADERALGPFGERP